MENTCTSTDGNVACAVPFEVVTARSSILIVLLLQIFSTKNLFPILYENFLRNLLAILENLEFVKDRNTTFNCLKLIAL